MFSWKSRKTLYLWESRAEIRLKEETAGEQDALQRLIEIL